MKGRAFNLGGGPANAVSLRQLLRHLEMLVGHGVAVAFEDWRPGDQRYYVSDPRMIAETLGLRPFLPWTEGVSRLVSWLAGERGIELPAFHFAEALAAS